jgi:hypothetical protein
VRLYFVRGHAGCLGNELADRVATVAAQASAAVTRFGVNVAEVLREHTRLNGWVKVAEAARLSASSQTMAALTRMWNPVQLRGLESASVYMENPMVRKDHPHIDRQTERFYNYLRLNRWDLARSMYPAQGQGLVRYRERSFCPWCEKRGARKVLDSKHVLERCYVAGDQRFPVSLLHSNPEGALRLCELIRAETGCFPEREWRAWFFDFPFLDGSVCWPYCPVRLVVCVLDFSGKMCPLGRFPSTSPVGPRIRPAGVTGAKVPLGRNLCFLTHPLSSRGSIFSHCCVFGVPFGPDPCFLVNMWQHNLLFRCRFSGTGHFFTSDPRVCSCPKLCCVDCLSPFHFVHSVCFCVWKF